MNRDKTRVKSPLHLLAQSMHGWPGRGRLGVVMARAGEGKTACLVQISLSHLMRGQTVLHVSLEHHLEDVRSWYDALFEHVATQEAQHGANDEVAARVTHRRMIVAFNERCLRPERLQETLENLRSSVGFRPDVVIVDGDCFEAHDAAQERARVEKMRSIAAEADAELWLAVQTHRETTGDHPLRIPAPVDAWRDLIEVALYLEPHEGDISVRLFNPRLDGAAEETDLHLRPKSHRLVTGEWERIPEPSEREHITLLSGGAAGTEAEFGECAERWGLHELNFTFAGRTPTRTRGLVWLSEQELAEGAVSPVYLQAHMHRTFPDTEVLRKTLQSIWHQVNTAGEVFAVGEIQPDQTVKGGTGWAVELGRLWKKPVHVYDQRLKGWFTWQSSRWVAEGGPLIRSRRFAGTGTRSLTEDGRAAIRSLFERSFSKE